MMNATAFILFNNKIKNMYMNQIFRILMLLMVLFVLPSEISGAVVPEEQKKVTAAELETIRNSFRNSILSESSVDAEKILIMVNTLQDNGEWQNIDYKDLSRQGFRHVVHLENMKQMARAYNTVGHRLYHNAKVKAAFDIALNYWLRNDFKAENWWFNEFGTPKSMKDLLLMMDDGLSEQQVTKMLQIAGRANSKAPGARSSGDRISIIGIEAQVALFKRDPQKLNECITGISKEVRYGASDGSKKCLQYDLSFHHRNDRVNNTLSYGLQYANDLALWADKVAGTQYEFSDASLRLLIDYYLDGICKQMVYGVYEDTGIMNRDISRETPFAPMSILTPKRLLHASDYRKEELQQIINLRKGKTKHHNEFAKFFWQSEYLAVQREGYFTSVRMFSTRNKNMEMPYNGEGLKNHYRGDGTNYLTLRGDEYHALPPVYDWMQIPGITSVITDSMPPKQEIQKSGKMDFVGAVTDGYWASAAFDFISPHHNLKARKSWFFFDEEYLCLGSGITSNEEAEVVTTLNQTALRGEIMSDQGILSEGTHLLKGTKWIHHDHVAYLFPENQNVCLSNQPETGYWTNISSQTSTSREKKVEKVMKLWIRHGKKCNEQYYSYLVVPNIGLKDVQTYTDSCKIRIIVNSEKIQAAENFEEGITFAHFYEPGTISFCGENTLTMRTRGLLMVKTDHKGKVKSVTCSDPTRKLESIKFILNGLNYDIALKSGQYAGTSETIIINK